jgi:nucleotide-binding universal stress UspA family protein
MIERELIGRPIVVGLDDSGTAQRALRTAVGLARALGSELVVVSAYRRVRDRELHAIQRDVPSGVAWRVQPNSAVRGLLDDAREQAEAAGIPIACVAREGPPARVIVDVAAETNAGLVIVGNRGMRGARRPRDSVPGTVAERASCSVLIVDTVSAAAA